MRDPDGQSPLVACGKPLFFEVGNAADLGVSAPANRLGEAVRVYSRSLSPMQKEALVIARSSGTVWRLASDEGAYLNGDDVAPCPLSFLTTGMICASMEAIAARAKSLAVAIARLELVQDNYYTMHGSALRGTMTGGARNVRLEVRIDSDADAAANRQLVHDAIADSPLSGFMRTRHESLFALTRNGEPVRCGRVAALDHAIEPPLPARLFAQATPSPGDWSRQITRNGLTPRTEETTGFAGSSLAENQDRTLHVRGIARRLPNGVKQVEQQLFNPHGSIFHFLCDESRERGGQGLAPDAGAYLSAGIAFCFMTQLGRFAQIAKKDLRDYSVVQDTHFSRVGACHNPPQGRAAAVETHVHLHTSEDDDFARRALDMSEQTCFLHALCRTSIDTEIEVRAFEDDESC